jgi:hypothetical protein
MNSVLADAKPTEVGWFDRIAAVRRPLPFRLELIDLPDAAQEAIFVLEFGGDEGLDQLTGERFADDT